jgi:hypothetical protein
MHDIGKTSMNGRKSARSVRKSPRERAQNIAGAGARHRWNGHKKPLERGQDTAGAGQDTPGAGASACWSGRKTPLERGQDTARAGARHRSSGGKGMLERAHMHLGAGNKLTN